MSDDRRKVKLDATRISLSQSHEVRWWTKALGVSLSQLEMAVRAMGTSVRMVREYLSHDVPVGEPVTKPAKARRKKAKKAQRARCN